METIQQVAKFNSHEAMPRNTALAETDSRTQETGESNQHAPSQPVSQQQPHPKKTTATML